MTYDPKTSVYQFANIANKRWDQRDELNRNVAEDNGKEEEREKDRIQLLRDIEESNFQIVRLIRKNSEINKELFILFQEMNTMMIAQNEDEAKGILTKVIEKAALINDGVAISILAAYGGILYEFIKIKYFN